MQKTKTKLLSVIVPARLQGKTIQENLEKINEVLRSGLGPEYDYEIICVVDGELDNTLTEAKKVKSPKVKVIWNGYKENQGKGFTVRYGMARSKGDIVAFIDAGLELQPNTVLMGLEHLKWYDADIIVGSKRHPASKVDYPLQRRVISFGTQILNRILFGLKVKDTQLGMKLFRRKVLEATLPRLLVKKYAFDIEMLAVANHLGFTKIYESPVAITYDFKDIMHAATPAELFYTLRDTLAVFYRLRILKYYDKK